MNNYSCNELMNLVQDAVVFLNSRYQIQTANTSFAQLCHLEQNALIGKPLNQVCDLLNKEEVPLNIQELIKNYTQKDTSKFYNEITLISTNGHKYLVDILLSIKLENKDAPFIFVLKNKTKEKNLLSYLARLEKISVIGRLVSNVTHDFNNQLTGILGYARILSRGLENEKLKNYANMIIDTANRAAELSSQLNIIAKPESGSKVLLDAHSLLAGLEKLLCRTIDKRIQIVLKLKAAKYNLRLDSLLFQNALLNLCLYAEAAMPDGEILKISTFNDYIPQEHFIVSISYNGQVISKDKIPYIFDPAANQGLTSVKLTVNQHAGFINVLPIKDKGMDFQMLFPIS